MVSDDSGDGNITFTRQEKVVITRKDGRGVAGNQTSSTHITDSFGHIIAGCVKLAYLKVASIS